MAAIPTAISRGTPIFEAVQSRLSIIHGGRDDLLQIHRRLNALKEVESENLSARNSPSLVTPIEPSLFADLPDWSNMPRH